jgi:sugar-specific transcriptional regulator TrmB
MITTKEAYNPKSLIDYQEKWRERKIRTLEKYLSKLKESA